MRARNIIGLVLVLFVLLYPAARRPAAGQVSLYTVINLGGVLGEGISFLREVNSSGQIVGRVGYVNGSDTRAVFWPTVDSAQHLGTLPGGDYSAAFGVNDAGQVVGTSNTGTTVRAFLWTGDGGMKNLKTLHKDTGSEAFDINNSGQIVGNSSGPKGVRAVIWRNDGKIKKLTTLPGGDYSKAFAINDSGQVVGTSSSSSGARAVMWTSDNDDDDDGDDGDDGDEDDDDGRGMKDLGTLPGDTSSEAFDINNSGQVVGYSSGPNGTRAFLWTKESGMQSLGTLPGGNYSRAYSINDSGQVVGTSISSLGPRAFLWTGTMGIKDLNTLISAPASFVLSEAHCINNLGQIGALSGVANHEVHTDDGDEHEQEHFYRAFLLSPS